MRLENNKNFFSKQHIHVGTLGRSEKIAQQPFLETLKEIMLNDSRIVFHWTGRENSKSINDFFAKYGLVSRTVFHGWVNPFDYLKQLDVYLDTFPFGTGETFVLAGLMGIPLVTMSSPYEANFTNLIAPLSGEFANLICTSAEEYCLKVSQLLAGLDQHCPLLLSTHFEDHFTPQSLTCSKQTAKFSEQLNL